MLWSLPPGATNLGLQQGAGGNAQIRESRSQRSGICLTESDLPWAESILERNGKSLAEIPIMSIENPTLAHFRHFSSLFTKLPSTTVENSLQITPFYAKQSQFQKRQNEHNFRHDKILRDFMPLTGPKNKPNSKPIQTQFNPKQSQLKPIQTQNKPNSKPIQTQFNPKQSQLKPIQTQNKPNQTQFSVFKSAVCSLKLDILLDLILIDHYNVFLINIFHI